MKMLSSIHSIEKISADFFENFCRSVSECHNHFACWRMCLPICLLSTFLSVCLFVCILFICLASFYQLPLLSVLPSVYLPVCPISVFLSICLSFYLSAICLSMYYSPFTACPSVSLSVYVCLLDCLYISLYICCLLPAFLALYICLSAICLSIFMIICLSIRSPLHTSIP
jgi:hypothetical protein